MNRVGTVITTWSYRLLLRPFECQCMRHDLQAMGGRRGEDDEGLAWLAMDIIDNWSKRIHGLVNPILAPSGSSHMIGT